MRLDYTYSHPNKKPAPASILKDIRRALAADPHLRDFSVTRGEGWLEVHIDEWREGMQADVRGYGHTLPRFLPALNEWLKEQNRESLCGLAVAAEAQTLAADIGRVKAGRARARI